MSPCVASEVGPVRLDVAELEREGGLRRVPLTVCLDAAEAGGDVVAFPSPLRGEAEAVATKDGVTVHVTLTGEALLRCARCLQSFGYPLRLSFAEHFRPGPPGVEPAALQGGEDEVPYVTYDGKSIELDEVIRQHVLLALPMKPLCRADCLGLCPRCGKNLNEGPCTCGSEEEDPRWAPLRQLSPGGPGDGQV